MTVRIDGHRADRPLPPLEGRGTEYTVEGYDQRFFTGDLSWQDEAECRRVVTEQVGIMPDFDLIARLRDQPDEYELSYTTTAGLWTGEFFPERGQKTPEVDQMCEGCPVKSICLEHALVNNETEGSWGGTSARQRRKLRKARGLTAPPRGGKRTEADQSAA